MIVSKPANQSECNNLSNIYTIKPSIPARIRIVFAFYPPDRKTRPLMNLHLSQDMPIPEEWSLMKMS
jgi:hypothetical protein